MASAYYNAGKKYHLNGAVDFDTDVFKVMLLTSSYTPNIDSHAYRSDLTNEVSGTGYSAGGATLGTVTLTQDNTNDRIVVDAPDVSWTTATITARYAVLYKSRGGLASADELVCYFDFGSDYTSTAGTFTIAWHVTNGLVLLT